MALLMSVNVFAGDASPRTELPLTIAQQGLWFLARLDEAASAAYNMVFAFSASTSIDRALLERTLAGLQRRHEVLRASVQLRDDEPRLVIDDDAPAIRVAEIEDSIEGYAEDESGRPFDLGCAPLLRACIVRAPEGGQGLVVTLPHIVFDGPSASVFFDELTRLSASLAQGTAPALAHAPAACADAVRREATWVASAEGQAALEDVLERLEGLPDRLALPRAAPPAPRQLVYRTALLEFFIDAGHTAQLAAAARAARATPAALYLGAFELLLWHCSGQADFAVTLPVMNRHADGAEHALGFFTNLGVVRSSIDAEASVADFLGRVTDEMFDMLETHELPFPLVAARLKRDRRDPQTPLMQIGFNHEATRSSATLLGDCALQPFELPPLFAKNELKLDILETEDGARGWLVVDRDGWADETVDAMAGHYLELLAAIAEDSRQRLRDMPPFEAE
jgi:hypothetical protein